MADSRSLTELLGELEGVEWYHSCLPGFLLSPLMEVARAAEKRLETTDHHHGCWQERDGSTCTCGEFDLINRLAALRDAIALDLGGGPMMLALGTKTQWGEVVAVGTTGGERYYWMRDGKHSVAMMPASAVEPAHLEEK